MATMKSLGCNTHCIVLVPYMFVSYEAIDRQWVHRADVYTLACMSNAWFYWFKQCVIKYHDLVLQDWDELKLRVSIKRTSIHWRALCVVCLCVMHCTVAVWILLVSCTLSSLSSLENIYGDFFSKHCLAKLEKGVDSVFLSLVSSLSDLAQCCVWPTPPSSAMTLVAVAVVPVSCEVVMGEDVWLPRSSPFWLGCWCGVGREGGSTVWGRTPLWGELSEEMPEEETLRPWSLVTAPPPPPPSVFTPGSAEPREESWSS